MSHMCVLAPTGIVGYGFPERSFELALKENPAVIGADAGSTDQGPGDLGAGHLHVSRDACKRDLELMLTAGRRLDVPVLVGTAGGAGAAVHVDIMREVVLEIARENNLHFSLATVYADVEHEYLHERIEDDATAPLDSFDLEALTHERVDECNRIVGVMGTEPYRAALKQGADVVLAGRSSDAAIFAAVPVEAGLNAGLAWHAGKLLECGGASAVPTKGGDSMLAWLDDEEVEVEPPNPDLICTPLSVAAHTMYENGSPYFLREPAGTLDTREATFDAVNERRVRITGSKFVPARRYGIKLEGAKPLGYRTLTLGVSQDPDLIHDVDGYIAGLERSTAESVRQAYGSNAPEYMMIFHQIGRNSAVVTNRPAVGSADLGPEVGILISVISTTQEYADAILAMARIHLVHSKLGKRGGLMSNVAFPFAPSDIPTGPVYTFNLNHLVFPEKWQDIFKIEMERI
jgi:hypothetical protein